MVSTRPPRAMRAGARSDGETAMQLQSRQRLASSSTSSRRDVRPGLSSSTTSRAAGFLRWTFRAVFGSEQPGDGVGRAAPGGDRLDDRRRAGRGVAAHDGGRGRLTLGRSAIGRSSLDPAEPRAVDALADGHDDLAGGHEVAQRLVERRAEGAVLVEHARAAHQVDAGHARPTPRGLRAGPTAPAAARRPRAPRRPRTRRPASRCATRGRPSSRRSRRARAPSSRRPRRRCRRRRRAPRPPRASQGRAPRGAGSRGRRRSPPRPRRRCAGTPRPRRRRRRRRARPAAHRARPHRRRRRRGGTRRPAARRAR